MRPSRSLPWVLCALLTACAQSSRPELLFEPSGDSGAAGRDGGGQAAGAGCNRMDILFVIDNSGSMSEEQENLAANFPRFIQVLDGFRGGSLQYRLGVTTTAFGDFEFIDGLFAAEEGALLQTPEMDDPWLDRGAPDLAATFAQLATVGLMGSANEQPLKAAQFALDARIDDGTNAGFLRPDALLALVFLTDEDDGSTQAATGGGATGTPLDDLLGLAAPAAPVSDFIEAYDAIAMGRDRWAAAVIAGDQEPQCSSDFGEADYAERLLEFVDQAGSQATFGSICSGDLGGELDAALRTFSAACQTYVPVI